HRAGLHCFDQLLHTSLIRTDKENRAFAHLILISQHTVCRAPTCADPRNRMNFIHAALLLNDRNDGVDVGASGPPGFAIRPAIFETARPKPEVAGNVNSFRGIAASVATSYGSTAATLISNICSILSIQKSSRELRFWFRLTRTL